MASIARGYPDPNGEIDHWVRKFLLPGRPTPTGKLLMTLTSAIKEGFTYTRRCEHGTQDPVVTVRSGRGSCRDFALLMMEAVRSLGLAARFVSGYLYVPSRDSSARAARGRGLCRRRLDPRLVPGLSAGRGLGGVRSHQRHHRQPRSHPRRGRARSEPGDSALRHLCGKPGRRAGDEGAGDSRWRITPEPAHIHWIHDPFGNCVALARLKTRASELMVREHDSRRL